MTSDARAARAALALAGLLFALALPGADPEPAFCAAPAELAAADGHTRAVGCDGRAPLGGAPLRGPARLLYGQRLDLNRADAASLEVLPGIGPSRAAAIIAARAAQPFEDVSELDRVPGLGPTTRARIAPYLAVGGGIQPDEGARTPSR